MPLNKKLDLGKIKNSRLKEEKEQGLLGFPVHVKGIGDVKESIDKLKDFVENKKDYDFDQIKDELTRIQTVLHERQNFKPLIDSLDEFTTKITSTHTSVTKQNKEDLSKLVKTIEDSIKGYTPQVNVKFNDVRVEYGAADYKIIDGTAYVGYVHPTGKWYILRQTGTTEGTFRYATGTKDYDKAWSLKSSQRYYSYDEVRL